MPHRRFSVVPSFVLPLLLGMSVLPAKANVSVFAAVANPHANDTAMVTGHRTVGVSTHHHIDFTNETPNGLFNASFYYEATVDGLVNATYIYPTSPIYPGTLHADVNGEWHIQPNLSASPDLSFGTHSFNAHTQATDSTGSADDTDPENWWINLDTQDAPPADPPDNPA